MIPMQATLFGEVNQPVAAMAGTWDPLLPPHIDVLTRLAAHAHKQKWASLLIMFDPAPAYFVSKRKDETAQWITYNEIQLTMNHVFSCGIDAVLLVHFQPEYLDFGVAELFQTVAAHVELAEFWFGARQSFGPGTPGSQTALIKLAKEQDIKLRRLASTTVNEVCGQIRHHVANGQPGQAAHLALTPLIRQKPSAGPLVLPWVSGSYRVLPLNEITGIRAMQTTSKLKDQAIELTLYPAAENNTCQCDWPDTNANYLAFLAGPHDNLFGNAVAASD